MTRMRFKRGLLGAATPVGLLLLVLGLGCKGAGKDGNSVTPCPSISFASSLSSPAAGDVSLASGASSCDAVDIGVLVTNLSGIFTVGFDLLYPSSIIAYQGFSAGPLLYQGSPPIAPLFFVQKPSPGEIVASGTLFRPDSDVSAINSATFITLHFVRVASGSGSLDFNTGPGSTINNQIIDDSGTIVTATFGPGHGGVVQVP